MWGVRADGRCEPCHDRHSTFRILPCRGVACYTRNSARRAAYGVRRGAACYALRRKAHRGVRGVNHHSVALPRVAGVARYALRRKAQRSTTTGIHGRHEKGERYAVPLNTHSCYCDTTTAARTCVPSCGRRTQRPPRRGVAPTTIMINITRTWRPRGGAPFALTTLFLLALSCVVHLCLRRGW